MNNNKIIKEIFEDKDFLEDTYAEVFDDVEVVNEAEGDEEEDEETEKVMSDEKLKIESLKIAVNMAKLMSNVTPDDIINIASSVADFIRNHEVEEAEAAEAEPTEEA